MTTRILLRRTVLPHATLAPLLFVWCALETWDPVPPAWVPDVAGGAALAGLAAAWIVSSVRVGRPLIGPFTPDDWSRLRAWWRYLNTPVSRGEPDTAWPFVTAVAGVVAGALVCAFLRDLWWSPLGFALFWQVVDLAVLGVALARAGAFRADPEEAERQSAEAERARRDGDRAAAVAAVRGFHAEHADLIAEEYPPVRLDTELRTRIPGAAGPDDAWRAAREFLVQLQAAVRAARQRRERELAESRPPDPVRDRASELRALIGQLDAQLRQTEEAVQSSREGGLNPAFLERQLADLGRRWREAADELERLTRPSPTPAPAGSPPVSLKYVLLALFAGALSLAGAFLRRPAAPPLPVPPVAPPSPPPPVPAAAPRPRILPTPRPPALFDHTPVAYPLGWRPEVGTGPFRHAGGPFVMNELHAAYHQLIIGTTGSGKSRLAEGQCRGLVDSLRGFCFIDMDGDTAENIAAYAAWKSEREGTDAICRQLVYVTFTVETLPGFDPFAPPDLSAVPEALRENARRVWLSTKVDQFGELVQAKQGGSDFTGMARLQRVLRTVLTAVGTAIDPSGRHLPLSEVFALLDCEHIAHPRVYAAVAPHLPGYVRDEFERWHGSPRAQRLQETESSLNRLRSLLSPLVLAVFTEPARRLDFRQVIDGRMILLVNLRQTDFLSADQQRAIATMFVHEIWSACKVVGREDRPVAPYYLYIDEAHLLMETAGADLQQILFRGRKYKVSLALIGQFLGQFRNERVDMIPALLNLCRTFTCFLHSSPDDLEILKGYFGYPNLDFTELMQVTDRPDGYDLLRLRDHSRSYSSGRNWSLGANETHALGTSDQVTLTRSHTDGVSDAAGEQVTATDGRAANAGTAVQHDGDGSRVGGSKTGGVTVNHADGRGTSSVHTAQSSDTTGVARARGETEQHGTGVNAGIGGSDQQGLTVSVKTTVVPKTREEWHPTGRLRASVEDQLHRVAQVIATLRNRQAVVRLFGEDRTFRIDVGDVPDVFPDPREMAARLRAFLAKVFAAHACYFTPDLSPDAEARRLDAWLRAGEGPPPAPLGGPSPFGVD